MNIYSKYLARIKNNIHLAIAMSPLGEVFSTRIRMFPSLINCCTIDWFTEWPEEALLAVGRGQISDFLLEHDALDSLAQMVEAFKTIHKSVESISGKYKDELRRYNYVTPTSYLEQLTVFKAVLKEKKVELKNSINRFKNGLNKLIEANNEVN
jgi:dynein heavy chain